MGGALPFAFSAALNPTLLTATLVMLFSGQPRRLMSGFLLGAYAVSISLGLVIVFALKGTHAVNTTQHTFSPAVDAAVGVLLLVVAFVAHGDKDARVQAYRRSRAEARGPKETPKWKKALDEGSARSAFGVGILLTLPGASYLAGMNRISKAHVSTLETIVAVVVFCLIMLLLIEIPLLGFEFREDSTRRTVTRFTDWVSHNMRMIVTRVALVMGSLLLLRAVITLLS